MAMLTLAELSPLLAKACNAALTVTAVQPYGGSFDRHCRVETSHGTCFVKLGPASAYERFAAEADGLAALAASGAVRVPEVIGLAQDERQAILVLEWLSLRPLPAELGEAAAQAIVALHETGSDVLAQTDATGSNHRDTPYGWHRDNFLGATPQHNAWASNWAHFWVTRRLQPQLAWAAAHGLARETVQLIETKVLPRAAALFMEYHPRPALLHGDLWSGNIAVDDHGTIVLYDPAVHLGDHEADLAMAELFGGFPERFYAAYRRLSGLHRDYERRKPLYTLYHLLNHFNLFGASYAREVARTAARLAATLS